MSSVTNVGIKLTLDGAAQAEAGLRRVQGGMAAIGNTAESVRGALQQLAGAFAGVVSVRAFVQAADAVTQLQNQLRLATGSAQAATAAYYQLFEIAQRSRVSFTELGGTFASIARASESLGLSQQQLLRLTETIGNAITVGGQSAAASQAALTQLSQGLASGVLRGEELNSILEQAPRLARALADGLGVSTGALREMGKEGELTAERVIGALQSQAEVLSNEVTDSVVTVGQAFTQLQNSATALVGEIDRVSGVSATLSGVVQAASDSLDNIARAFRDTESAGQQFNVFADAIAVVFETVAVLGVNVAFVIKTLGAEIGGIAAQATAVARLDFSAAREISRLMREDAEAARREVDALSKRILNSRRLAEQARQSLQGVDTRAEDARLAHYARQAEGVRKVGVAAADTKKKVKDLGDEFAAQREAAKGWADAYQDFMRLAAQASAESLGLTKAQARLVEFLSSPAYANASEPMRQLALDQAYAAIAAEQNAAAQEQQAKALKELERSAESAEEQLQRLLDEERALVIAAERNITLAQAIEEVAIARLRERQAAMMAEGDRDAEVQAIQREIDARKQLAEAIGRKEAREAATESAREAARAWEKFADDIERSLTDSLYRSFEAGKDFGETFVDSLRNTIKAAVLKLAVQVVVEPVMGGIRSAFGISNAASTGANLLSLANNGISSLGLGAMQAGLNTATYTTFAGMGVEQAAMLAAQDAVFGMAGTSATLEAAGATMASGFAAALPWVAGGLLVADALGVFDGGGGEKTEGGYVRTIGGGSSEYSSVGSKFFTGDNADAVVAKVLEPLAQSIEALASKLGGSAKGIEIGLGFNTDPAGTAADSVSGGVFVNGKVAYVHASGDYARGSYPQELQAEATRLLLAALKEVDLNDLADAFLDSLNIASLSAEAAVQAVQFVQATQQVVDAFGNAFGNLGVGADRISLDLIDAMGGLNTAAANLSGYAKNYLTESEQIDIASKALEQSLEAVGLTLPNTIEGYRALIEQHVALGEAGNEELAVLLNNQQAFYELAQAMSRASEAAAKLSREERIKQLTEQSASIETEANALLATYGDLVSAMKELNAPAETLVDRWRKNTAAITEIQSALDNMLGSLDPSNIDLLRGTLEVVQQFSDLAENLDKQIFSLRISSASPTQAVELWRQREAALWDEFRSATDANKPGIAQQIVETTLDRIKAEGAARAALYQAESDARQEQIAALNEQIAALNEQINAAEELAKKTENLKEIVAGFADWVSQMRFGDLSALSPEMQLAEAQSLYQRTLEAARAGDAGSVGNLQQYAESYLSEAQKFYGGATSSYAGIFAGVMDAISGFDLPATNTSNVDLLRSQLATLEMQEKRLSELKQTTVVASNEQIEVLGQLRDTWLAQANGYQQRADEQIAALREQLAQLRTVTENQEAEIRQRAAAYEALQATLKEIADDISALRSGNDLAMAAP